jgi:copper chaperone
MIEWNIPTMSCGHCAGVVTRTVQQADPAAKVQIDLAQRQVQLETTADPEKLRAALAAEGYAPA